MLAINDKFYNFWQVFKLLAIALTVTLVCGYALLLLFPKNS